MMECKKLGIAVDHVNAWHEQYAATAERLNCPFEVFSIERSDWIRHIQRYGAVLWRPNLDPPYCEEAREKIYYMEHVLGKRVVPNWATFWHYDNKRAQAYLFEAYRVPSPRTFVSYSREEALVFAREADYPIVSKSAGGASSEAVRLLRSPSQASREVDRVFNESLTSKVLRRLGARLYLSARSLNRYVLWQEFIGDNDRDLRITVIGGTHCFAFWRNNRPGDFRASGSGRIDYEVANVEQEIRFCLDLCRTCGFDSMAFDLVYRGDEFVVLEMSYMFNAKAIYNTPGHYLLDERGGLVFRLGQVWPQCVIAEYAIGLLNQA